MKNYFFIVFFISVSVLSCKNKQENRQETKDFSNLKKRDTVGIDISAAQNRINWKKVKSDSNYFISFVIARATMGDNRKDKMFANHIHNAKNSNILVGAYHFFDLEEDGKQQALNYLKAYKLFDLDFQPIVDIEIFKYSKRVKYINKTILVEKKNKKSLLKKDKKRSKNFTKKNRKEKVYYTFPENKDIEQAKKQLKIFIDLVEEKTNKKVIIYASASFFERYLNDFENPRWVSAISRSTSGINGLIHQFTFSLRVKGIKGNVDGNRFVSR